MSMKILHIVPSYKPAYVYGGPIMSVAELCEWTVNAGHDVSVFTTTANGNEELRVETGIEYWIENVRVFYFSRWTKDHTHFSPALMVRLLKDSKNYDVIHIHSWWNFVTLFSVLILKLKRQKFILSPRGMFSPYTLGKSGFKQKVNNLLGRWLLGNAIFHATSTQESTELKQFFKANIISVIPNFVRLPADVFLPKTVKFNSQLKLLFLSRVDQKKGLEKLFHILSKTKRPFTLTIAGNGDEFYINQLKQLTETLGISHQVHWIGFVNSDEKFKVYYNHDLTVLLSENENFANVVAESIAMGTPVLISSHVGLSDWVLSEKMGWVMDQQADIIAFLDQLNPADEIISNANRLGWAKVKSHFYSDSLTAKYISTYQETVYAK